VLTSPAGRCNIRTAIQGTKFEGMYSRLCNGRTLINERNKESKTKKYKTNPGGQDI